MSLSLSSSLSPDQPSAAAASTALTELKRYLVCFNERNLPAVAECLDPNVQVYVDGSLVATGRDSILPSYQQDFNNQKKVVMQGQPTVMTGDNPTTIQIAVHLQATSPESTVSLHVVYSFDATTMKQIRHDISNVVVVMDPSSSHSTKE